MKTSARDVDLPYFDTIIDHLESDDEMAEAFGRHVHWGYWSDPETALGSASDYAEAAELLSQKIYDPTGIVNGISVLDVGCGFGGTVSSLNSRYHDLSLTGLNLDQRQIDIARERVKAMNGNRIEFVQGDAVNLPFEDNSFDVLLAVECIFHFSSRERFLLEAERVLKPGGRIAFSDFVPLGSTSVFERTLNFFLRDMAQKTYGHLSLSTTSSYKKLAKKCGFAPFNIENVTANTLPTYEALKQLENLTGSSETKKVNAFMERTFRLGLLRYMILWSVLSD